MHRPCGDGAQRDFDGIEAAKERTVHFRRRRAGFTYIELLVAMVIVVTLYAVVWGPSEATKRRREMAACAENLRKLHLTLGLYASEHDGAYPAVKGARRTEHALGLLAPQYTTDATFLACPVKSGGYNYVMGLKKDGEVSLLAADRLAGTSIRKGAPLFAKEGNHGESGGNLLFSDGHVEPAGNVAPRDLTIPAGAVMLQP
jgi:prepilin-type N-terminal cleavage/methylation domain-containing protein/prepilin-type processing-associated H-X9-DG protein